MKSKKLLSVVSLLIMMAMLLSACTQANAANPDDQDAEPVSAALATAPKYIFLFIGDGMSYPQVQSAAYYLGTVSSDGGVETRQLSFMQFPVAGSAQTYDSTSFAPDSASTATSIATGNKTWSGTINMDTTFTVAFEAISEQLKAQKNYQVGIVTSVNLNHATPAAFYAHQESRNSYYDIGLELIASGFEYFAGGALLKPDNDGESEAFYTLAQAAGYKVARTAQEADAITADDSKVIIIAEQLDNSSAMKYSLDAAEGDHSLADYVEKGIEVLYNETGFFMMVEGGKIDWAGHANDAGANIHDTLAFDDAVQVAVDFYNQHPTETLILVTGDHETGGMSIGFAGLDYDLYLASLQSQTITYTEFDDVYVSRYKAEGTAFETVLQDVKTLFGLTTEADAKESDDAVLVMSAYELEQLKNAYERTLAVGSDSKGNMSEEEYLLYGTYEPLSVTLSHIMNNKVGISFTSYAHTGLPVPVFAMGVGCDLFEGYYDNTDIYHNLKSLTGVN